MRRSADMRDEKRARGPHSFYRDERNELACDKKDAFMNKKDAFMKFR